MKINRIKLENIRSYESQEIVFPIGSTILSGDIGSGKTSVLLAIEFALFGLQPGQKGFSLLRNNKDEGKVELELEIDGKKIILERGLKKSKTVNQSFAKIITEDKQEDISVTELKNRVLEFLNYPKEFARKTNLLYRFTVYTPQEEMKQIILETPETRLDTLRHIFGIDKYKRIRDNTELFLVKLREQIRNYEGQIKNLEDLRKKLEDNKNKIKELEENLIKIKIELLERKKETENSELQLKEVELKIKEKEKYEQEAEKTRIMLIGKKEIIENIERQKISLLKQIEESKKISFDPELILKLELEIKEKEKIQQEKNNLYLDLSGKINSLNSKIQESLKLKSQISSLKLCPTCFQDVDDDYKKNIVRKFDEDTFNSTKELKINIEARESIIRENEKLRQEILILKRNIDEQRLLKLKLEGIQEKEARINEFEKQKIFAEKDILLLEKQLDTLRESSSLLKKYDSVYEQKNLMLKELQKRERIKELELASTEKEKDMTLIYIKEFEKEINQKEGIKEKLLNFSELEDWLSEKFLEIISFTERNIMLTLREEFSKLFNEWFNILVPEIFSVRLDEDFTPIIEQQDFSLDYSFLSGGERTAIALAYRLALNQTINSLMSKIKTKDIVILDEPTDGFSEQQLDKMRDVLNQLKVKQLIIVSHESKIESFVDNIIKFKKHDGITKVE